MSNKEPNSTCVVCGTRYYVCKKCIELYHMGTEPWRVFANSPECFQIYTVLKNYDKGYTEAEMAKEQLANFEYDKDKLNDELRAIYDRLFTEEKEEPEEETTETPVEHKKSKKYLYGESKKIN